MSLEALRRNGHNLDLTGRETTGKYNIPTLKAENAPERINWIGFNSAITDLQRYAHGVHFFIDDYLFERAWNDPTRYAALLRDFRAVLTADFSMFTDYPKAVQIYNHWRKHQLGAYWQSLGMIVYPSAGAIMRVTIGALTASLRAVRLPFRPLERRRTRKPADCSWTAIARHCFA